MMATLTNGMAPSGYIPDDAAFGYHTFEVVSSEAAARLRRDGDHRRIARSAVGRRRAGTRPHPLIPARGALLRERAAGIGLQS